jgi:RNA ligase
MLQYKATIISFLGNQLNKKVQNMTFPVINHIDDLLPHIADKSEIKVVKHENGCTIISYMFQDRDTFAGPGGDWARECRGITFDADGSVASRTFHKFFNVNERVETKEEAIDWSDIQATYDKRDGSMISPVKLGDKIVFKTKKSFDNDISMDVNEMFDSTSPEYRLSEYLLTKEVKSTPIFEYTAPNNRIVLKYNEAKLTLLAVRDNVTGRYWTYNELLELCNKLFRSINLVDVFPTNTSSTNWLSNLKTVLASAENFEGYVFATSTGERYKWKCDWYDLLHHNCTFTTERNIAEMVADEKVDDFKAYCVSIGDTELFNKVEEIESRAFTLLQGITNQVETTVKDNAELEVKAFCLKFNKDPLFHLMIALYKNKDVNYIDYFKKYVLDAEFSADTI